MSTQETALQIQARNKLKICDLVIKACAELKEAEHLAENNKALPELHAIMQNRIENDANGELEYLFRIAIATMKYSKYSHVGYSQILEQHLIQGR